MFGYAITREKGLYGIMGKQRLCGCCLYIHVLCVFSSTWPNSVAVDTRVIQKVLSLIGFLGFISGIF